jgi:hypothetical protein
MPGAHVGSTDGAVGLRINHNLDVHVSEFTVTPKRSAAGLAPAARPAMQQTKD